MFYALNKEGIRVNATRASKEEKYVCPICGEEVYPKQGTIVSHHFAHKNECLDSWHYEEMTVWHKEWQESFPEEFRGVVVTNELGEKHRADVMVGDIVIEFQHSPISSEDFNARNKFYLDLGKRLIWVFDKREEFGVSILEVEDSDTLYRWKRYPKVLDSAINLIEGSDDFALVLDIGNNCLVHITSCIQDNSGRLSLFYFKSEVPFVEDKNNFDFSSILIRDDDRLSDLIKELDGYTIKNVSGIYSGSKENRYCDRRNTYQLQSIGETACGACKYCAGLLLTEDMEHNRVESTERAICTYPKQYREGVLDGADVYECEQARIYYV